MTPDETSRPASPGPAAEAPLRPADLARLLLAAGEHLPRARARDQQADRAGMDLRRRMLDQVAALDPEPGELAAALLRLVEEAGSPSGPARAVAAGILDEWQQALTAPGFVPWLVELAVRESEGRRERRRDRAPH